MENHQHPFVLSPTTPRLPPSSNHRRNISRSPNRNRVSVTDDIFNDFSPTRILDAFINPTGRLKASIEAASQPDRLFGIRAASASKNIQEWVRELEEWEWPAGGGSLGFEVPVGKRRKLSNDVQSSQIGSRAMAEEAEYLGSLPASTVAKYESRVDQIHNELEDLRMEEIKRHVLDTHFAPSRPSSSSSNASSSVFSFYTKMEDFTAIVTATVLKALPNLSKLMGLMDVWSVRLRVLRRVPRLLRRLEDGERALKSGWLTIKLPIILDQNSLGEGALSRETLEIMKTILQEKVTQSGQDLDCMLDALEGREDVLPDAWLDRMDTIERDYGEWAVAGDRKVRESEWAKMAKIRREEEEGRKRELEAKRLKAENDKKVRDAEIQRLEAEKRLQEAEAARLKGEEDALSAIAMAEHLRLERLAQADITERDRREDEAETPKLVEEEKVEKEAEKSRAHQEAIDAEISEWKADQPTPYLVSGEQYTQDSAKEIAGEAEILQYRLESVARNDVGIDPEHQTLATSEATTDKQEQEAQEGGVETAKIGNDRNQNIDITHRKDEKNGRDSVLEAGRLEEEQEIQPVTGDRSSKQEELNGAPATAEKLKEEPRDRETAPSRLGQEGKTQNAASKVSNTRALDLVEGQQAETEAREQAPLKLEEVQVAEKTAVAKQLVDEAKTAKTKKPSNQAEQEAEDITIPQQEATVASEAESLRPEQIATVEAASTQVQVNQVTAAELVAAWQNQDQEAKDVEIWKLKEEEAAAEKAHDIPTVMDDTPATEDAGRDQFNLHEKSEAETARLKALKAAEDETAQVARLRALLQTTGNMESAMSDSSDSEWSPNSPAQRSLSDFIGSSPNREPVPLLSQNLNSSGSSNCGDSENESSPVPPIHPTFDGGNDMDYEFFASYANPKIVSAAPVELARDNIVDSSILPTRKGKHPLPSSAKSSAIDSLGSSSPPSTSGAFISEPETFRPKEVTRSQLTKQPTFDTKRYTFGDFYNQDVNTPSTKDGSMAESHSKSPYHSPLPTGYSTSDATPEALDADQASYFRPLRSPVKSSGSSVVYSEPATPASSIGFSNTASTAQVSPTFGKPSLPTKSPRRHAVLQEPFSSPTKKPSHQETRSIRSTDGSVESTPAHDMNMELVDFQQHSLARKTSITRFSSPSPISISRRDSVSSTGSTVVNGNFGDTPSSPMHATSFPIRPSTPTSPRNTSSFQEDDISPSIRRHRNGNSHDYTSPDSPPPIPHSLSRSSISHQRNESASMKRTSPNKSSFNMGSPLASPKKANADDQLQQQISTLLESIPARIRLTTELDSSPAESLDVKKTRRPMAPRSSSGMSNYSRAPTPSFTLAPAQVAPRQRAQNSNPEIKVYHLSRSTGEAPIKLFVRLVGENGERVMVRVGGGWADLGEYLKEYASHHGRRAAIGDDAKVEIQDLPPRIVSSGSSTATPRASGRSSPVSRPASALGLNRPTSAFGRPLSSLAVRKTRKSVGDTLDLPSSSNTFRSPSTPVMPSTLSRSNTPYETPPSNPPSAERSISRLSWTEEEPGLGLAGPKSKKVVISERDQEWVDSMKMKVRQASAEKERKKEREKSFGEMDKVGGTKRLFRKGL